MSCTIPPNTNLIKMSVNYLRNFLVSQKQMGGLIRVGSSMKDLMMLSYYRNNLAHLFMNEAFVLTSILCFGTDYKLGIPKERILDQTLFLVEMIGDEFIMREKISSEEIFDESLVKMQQSGLVSMEAKQGKTFVKLERHGF
mmetsp:Transcript_39105/g.37429  ORF Transcript_39105/g.37429 Transcript_39105/m.37429 type:complete len:141 (+) Transcript_39105:772-1194(+)